MPSVEECEPTLRNAEHDEREADKGVDFCTDLLADERSIENPDMESIKGWENDMIFLKAKQEFAMRARVRAEIALRRAKEKEDKEEAKKEAEEKK